MNRGSKAVPADSLDAEKPGAPEGLAASKLLLGTPVAFLVTLLVTFGIFQPVLHYTFAPIDDAANVLSNPYLSAPAHQDVGYFFAHPFTTCTCQ